LPVRFADWSHPEAIPGNPESNDGHIDETMQRISCCHQRFIGVFMKMQSIVFAGIIGIAALAPFTALAAADAPKSVAELHKNQTALAGKTITAQGKVVKVNNGIMGRNFVHVQDGTGDASSNNLIVTSKQTANVGDQVKVSGVVVVNRDFGGGYTYPLLIEEASITVKK
jgi:hypothetical protein